MRQTTALNVFLFIVSMISFFLSLPFSSFFSFHLFHLFVLLFPGTIPKEASFAMHAILINHFMYGASYPRGGASEIALHITQALEKRGSTVLVRAKVDKILLNPIGHVKGMSQKSFSLKLSINCYF